MMSCLFFQECVVRACMIDAEFLVSEKSGHWLEEKNGAGNYVLNSGTTNSQYDKHTSNLWLDCLSSMLVWLHLLITYWVWYQSKYFYTYHFRSVISWSGSTNLNPKWKTTVCMSLRSTRILVNFSVTSRCRDVIYTQIYQSIMLAPKCRHLYPLYISKWHPECLNMIWRVASWACIYITVSHQISISTE